MEKVADGRRKKVADDEDCPLKNERKFKFIFSHPKAAGGKR